MIKLITKFFLMLVMLISAASICAAQWEDGSGSDETNLGWGDGITNFGPETSTNGGINQNTDSWGSPPPAEVSEPSDEAYFPRSVSESTETLMADTASAGVMSSPRMAMYAGGGSGSKNIFWIVSKDGTKHWMSVKIPCGSYARLLIIPSTSGQLIMEELYPNMQVKTYYYGYVEAQKPYKKWFFADTEGIHRMRYRIDNGPYSDIMTFYVGKCKGDKPVCPCCGRPL
jgi:hypothetical protein